MQWINFLHLYQPGNAEDFIIREATEKSYLRIIRALEKNPNLRFTFNINGCLIQRWQQTGYHDVIRRIKRLVGRNQIELVGTASYHPLLPLISQREAKKQILENNDILKGAFGENIKLKGFFSPEMAYSPSVGELIKKLGYKYVVLDEITAKGKLSVTDTSKIYEDKKSKLKVIFRSRKISQSYVPETILKMLDDNDDKRVVITATDAELYGLRHCDPDAFFEKTCSNKKLATMTISDFIRNKPVEKISLVSSTWESTERRLEAGHPFLLWKNKNNALQNALWGLADLAQNASEKFKNDKNRYWTDWHLVRGLASCTFWWASGRDFRPVFGPVAWNPDSIEKGANELIRAIRSIDSPRSIPIKIKAEKIYLKILKLIWINHWKKLK